MREEPIPVHSDTTPSRFVLRVIFSAKRFTLPAGLLAVVHQVGESTIPLVMGAAIDRALDTGDVAQLVFWILALAVLYFILTSASRISQWLNERGTQLVQHRLRATLSREVLHAQAPRAGMQGGGIVSTMTNDVNRLAALGLVVFAVGEAVAIVYIAVSLLLIHWQLGLLVVLGAPFVVWIMGRLSGQYARDSRVYQSLLADTVGRATDLVAGYRIIKGIRAEEEATRRYREASRETLAGAKRNVGLLGRFAAGSDAVSGVFVAIVAGLAGYFAVTGSLSVGGLIAAVGLSQALLPQMRMIAGNAVPAWASAKASSARVLDALRSASNEVEPAERATSESEVRPSSSGPAVLVTSADGVHIDIKPGELVGVRANDRVAAQLADALLNPYRAGNIDVRIDGVAAKHLDPDAYRGVVTVAPHRVTLFSGTVAENLDLGAKHTAGREPRREAALRAAACDDFAARDESGRLTGEAQPVGDDGVRLSGGQRQRIALARAYVSEAQVLVLHDPTTAVDSVTESVIAARLREVRPSGSTIILATSPALLAICDRVIDVSMDASEGSAA